MIHQQEEEKYRQFRKLIKKDFIDKEQSIKWIKKKALPLPHIYAQIAEIQN